MSLHLRKAGLHFCVVRIECIPSSACVTIPRFLGVLTTILGGTDAGGRDKVMVQGETEAQVEQDPD